MKPALALSLQFADATDRVLLPRHRVVRWIRAALMAPAELTLRVVGADEGRALNASYRRRGYATNVLTFAYGAAPAGARPRAAREPLVVADIVLCAPVVAAEAAAQGIPREAHYAHLIVHGTLHAQGFDHVRVRDAKVMEARESAVLAGLGFADPYVRR